MKILVADALAILPYPGPKAAMELTKAIHSNDCRLWCDGTVVKLHFAAQLIVEPHLESDGRWIGVIATAGMMLGFNPDSYRWELERDEVMALAPPPQPSPPPEPKIKSQPSSIGEESRVTSGWDQGGIGVTSGRDRGATVGWQDHARNKLQDLPIKARKDMHKRRQLRVWLERKLADEGVIVSTDPKKVLAIIHEFLRSG
jgi:hypothetical protein